MLSEIKVLKWEKDYLVFDWSWTPSSGRQDLSLASCACVYVHLYICI